MRVGSMLRGRGMVVLYGTLVVALLHGVAPWVTPAPGAALHVAPRRAAAATTAAPTDAYTVTEEEARARTAHVTDAALRARCVGVLMGKQERFTSQYGQDALVFANFVARRRLHVPGVYLDLGANDPLRLSNTAFFDLCLGWRGVCVEPNPAYAEAYAQKRTCRLVPHCLSLTNFERVGFNFKGAMGHVDSRSTENATCITLEHVLRTNADILGAPDERGALASALNFVSFDVEGAEAPLIACTDLFALFSSRPAWQAWTVETLHLESGPYRAVDAAMALAGYVKHTALFRDDGTFHDDVYVMRRPRPRVPAHMRCANGNASCALAHVMKAYRAGSKTLGAMPILCPGAPVRDS